MVVLSREKNRLRNEIQRDINECEEDARKKKEVPIPQQSPPATPKDAQIDPLRFVTAMFYGPALALRGVTMSDRRVRMFR